MSFGSARMRTSTLQMLFWAFAALMGLSMSTLFLAYTGASIAQTFFATAAAYLGLSLWGYTTKRDLSGLGTFLIMGVVGLLVAMLINLFLHSPAMALAISAIGVLLFAGLTAYDTQRIKSMYFYVAGTEMAGKTVVMGALTLYLDFINMFQFLLQLHGQPPLRERRFERQGPERAIFRPFSFVEQGCAFVEITQRATLTIVRLEVMRARILDRQLPGTIRVVDRTGRPGDGARRRSRGCKPLGGRGPARTGFDDLAAASDGTPFNR